MDETEPPRTPKGPDEPESPPAQVKVEQRVGTVAGDGQVTAVSIGQMRDAIFRIEQRALTAEEAAQRAADIELELLARGVHGLTQRLAAQLSAAPSGGSPYKGLLAYGLGDAERFYGRDTATAELLDLLRRGRLAVLHAESGAGKSSLLQAGIAAHLIGSGHLAVYLRPYNTAPATAIKGAFLDLSRAPRLAGLPLRDFLRYVTDILSPGETLYLLLDQFEEFFAYLDQPARNAFSAELGECLHDESLNVRWLVALRGEALSRLAEMESAGVKPFENRYCLARLTRDEARKAVTGPGFAFEAGLVETILDTLTKDGEIVPPQLQLVCLALTEGLTPPDAISREQYDRLGGTEGILRDYLVRQVGQFPAEEREPARRLLRALVTAEGRRAVLAYPDLVAEWQVQGGEQAMLDTILARLVERRLLVVQERTTDGERTYELAHDYLLREIQLDPAEQARKAVQEMLNRAVLDYRANPRMLLDDDKFDAINARRKELVLSSQATELVDRSEAAIRRRRTVVLGGMALVAGLAVVAVVLGTLIIGAREELRRTQNDIATSEAAAQAAVTREATALQAAQMAFERSGLASVPVPGALAFDGTRLWVASSNTIQAIDPTSGFVNAVIPVESQPSALLFAAGQLWVANAASNTVQVVDPSANKVMKPIPVGKQPTILLYDGAGRVGVGNRGDDTIQMIDVDTHGVTVLTPRIPLQALASDGTRLWVAANGSVEQFDIATGERETGLHIAAEQVALAYDGNLLWVLTELTGDCRLQPIDVARFNFVTPDSQHSFPCYAPGGLIFNGGLLWTVDRNTNSMRAIDPATGLVSQPVVVGKVPTFITSDGATLWVANTGDDTVQKTKLPSALLFDAIRTDVSPIAPEFSSHRAFDGQREWRIGEDGLEAVNPATGEIAISPIPIDDEFQAVALAVAGGQLWMGGYITSEAIRYSVTEGYVIPIDLASINELQEISLDSLAILLDGTPSAMAFDGTWLWIVEDGNPTIQAIDPVSTNIVRTIQTDINPDDLVVEGSRLWLRNVDGKMLQYLVLIR